MGRLKTNCIDAAGMGWCRRFTMQWDGWRWIALVLQDWDAHRGCQAVGRMTIICNSASVTGWNRRFSPVMGMAEDSWHWDCRNRMPCRCFQTVERVKMNCINAAVMGCHRRDPSSENVCRWIALMLQYRMHRGLVQCGNGWGRIVLILQDCDVTRNGDESIDKLIWLLFSFIHKKTKHQRSTNNYLTHISQLLWI